MPKFTHPNYDGKHWIKGTAEYALDNELNRLNKQVMKFAKANATNSKYYKQLVTELQTLSNGNIKFNNGVPQAQRGAKVIADAAKKRGDKLFKKIAKSKSHASFGGYKEAAKRLGLTPNELSYISNESALYYEAMYAEEDDDNPLDYLDGIDDNPFKGRANMKSPHTFSNDPILDKYDREIFVEDIITPRDGGFYNVVTGEWFEKSEDSLASYDQTIEKIRSGEWSFELGHFGGNIDWEYYNQFKRKGEW